MSPAADARAVLHYLDVAAVARAAWRAADGNTDAAVVLEMGTGAPRVLTWPAGSVPAVPAEAVVLAYAPASRVPDLTRALARGTELPPSGELVEEHVVRASVEAFAAGCEASLAVEKRLAEAFTKAERGAPR